MGIVFHYHKTECLNGFWGSLEIEDHRVAFEVLVLEQVLLQAMLMLIEVTETKIGLPSFVCLPHYQVFESVCIEGFFRIVLCLICNA